MRFYLEKSKIFLTFVLKIIPEFSIFLNVIIWARCSVCPYFLAYCIFFHRTEIFFLYK